MRNKDREASNNRRQRHLQPAQHAAGRHDVCRRVGTGVGSAGANRAGGAEAAAAAAGAGKKPNILVICGDDIGITNISAYSDGLMGYKTPNIDRIGQRRHPLPALLRRAVLHRRPRGVPHRPARHPHRTDQGRLPRRADGHEPARSVDRRPAEEPRLRHRPVRQEPRRRSQPDRCRRSTASTSSSATSITSTPRKSRSCPTIRRIRPTAPSSARAAC